MPLVRFEVRNEYGLGDPELYRAEAKKEDPRAVLDGVAVAGFVGILRQLGDLAEFAADIFHDLQEQVITTTSRGRKMLNRIQRIESALPSIEKAVQGQRNYIHFAYIAGSDWHAKVRIGQSQLLSSDLPQFMIDSYEECHDPPRLYLLDKFDSSGAGACLKRYSDPSYFKRALASSEPVKAEKVHRKKKKRGPRLRNEGIPNAVFTSRDSSSKQYASPSTDQLSFSGENASFFDTRSKSELARESMHLDSETRSNCVDQVSDMPSMVPCKPEYSGFSAPASKSNNSNASASVQNEPKQDMADDNSQPESLHQQSAPSTSVTWDEKTEIVKSAGANLYEAEFVDRVQDLHSQSQIFETSNLDSETTKVGTFNQEDIVFELAEAPVSYPCGNLFDDVPTETGNFAPVSYPGGNLFDEDLMETGTAPVPYPDGNMSGEASTETDNFKDATTALEPELGSDSECQTKLELKSSNFNYGVLESRSCELNETSVTDSDCFDAQVPIAPCSSLTNSVLSDGFDHVQSTDTNCHSPKYDFSVGNGYSKGHIPCMPGTSVSRLLNDELSPNPSIPNEQDVLVSNGTTDETSKTQDCPVNNSKLPSVSFWTNGGILGLEPSKPPDFSINANSEAVAMCNGRKSRNVCSSGEERDKSDGDLPVRKISRDCLQGPSLTDLGKNEEAPSGGTYAYTKGPYHREIDVYSPVSDLTAIGNTVSHSSGSDKNLTGISTSFSGLANKFISNSLQRRILVAHAGLSTPSQLVNADFRKLQEILLQNDHKELPKRAVPNALREPETEENIEVGSSGKPVPYSSPYLGSYSPPLELMKISFHPMNSLDTSKLKLEFSSGNLHEGTGDLVFPSFQLIPGPSTTVQVCGSESDDDTFCRSSVYSSDDLLSLYSESNSGFWGEDERSDSQKHSVSDDSCRNSSSATSVCSTMKFEQMDRCSLASELEHLEVENGRISDSMKDLTLVNSIVDDKCQQHEICESLPFNSISSTAHSPNELPPPPPLPPLQWRVVKESDKNHSVEDNNSNCMRVIEHLDAEAQSYATHKQQEHDAPRSSCNAEAVAYPLKKMDQLILTGTGGQNCNYNVKEQNRREDLLDQIRSKSFNLRRTTTAKLNHASGPVTDAAVAVMGKEHVIQQAFSFSHMRRDDNWSEG